MSEIQHNLLKAERMTEIKLEEVRKVKFLGVIDSNLERLSSIKCTAEWAVYILFNSNMSFIENIGVLERTFDSLDPLPLDIVEPNELRTSSPLGRSVKREEERDIGSGLGTWGGCKLDEFLTQKLVDTIVMLSAFSTAIRG